LLRVCDSQGIKNQLTVTCIPENPSRCEVSRVARAMLQRLESRGFLVQSEVPSSRRIQQYPHHRTLFCDFRPERRRRWCSHPQHRQVCNLLLFGGFRRARTSEMAAMVSRSRKPDPGIRRSTDGSFLFCNRAAYEVRGRACAIGGTTDSHYPSWFFDRVGSRDHSPTSHSIAHHLSCPSGLAVHDLANSCCGLRKTSNQATSLCGDPTHHRTCSAAPAAGWEFRTRF
jgi:hypothetical protein